jgi:hypothetical protein
MSRPLQPDDPRQEQLERLVTTLQRTAPGCRLRLNRNRKTMLSLRGRPGGWTISLHIGLLDHPQALEELPGWIASRGHQPMPRLRRILQTVWAQARDEHLAEARSALPETGLAPLGRPLDLDQALDHVHRTWFAHLSRPVIRWARNHGGRTLTSIRFGCYRSRPLALITINPRLARPWVPWVFIEHVLHHELCHHAQACAPVRGERAHSPRFRAWERQYPHHQLALTWERLHLERLMRAAGPGDAWEGAGGKS